MVELIKAAYVSLVEKGYPPELAYFCLHETKLITNLITEFGIEGMYNKVSNTAEYGGRTVGRKIIDENTKKNMENALSDVINGKFADEWIEEFKKGLPNLSRMREEERKKSIEEVGKSMREIFKNKDLK